MADRATEITVLLLMVSSREAVTENSHFRAETAFPTRNSRLHRYASSLEGISHNWTNVCFRKSSISMLAGQVNLRPFESTPSLIVESSLISGYTINLQKEAEEHSALHHSVLCIKHLTLSALQNLGIERDTFLHFHDPSLVSKLSYLYSKSCR